MPKNEKKNTYVIKKIEIEQYHEFCNNYKQKTKLVLQDFLCNDVLYSERSFGHVCDVSAQCSALSVVLESFFALDSMDYEGVYQMESKVATTIIKIYLTILNTIQVLRNYNVYLEDN